MECRLGSVENKLDTIENKLDDVEVNNASRHVQFIGDMKDLKRSVIRIEVNTAENWIDIAGLKAK